MAGGLVQAARSRRFVTPEMKGTARRLETLGALEAADGMLLFGISTAFVFAVIQRIERTFISGSQRLIVNGLDLLSCPTASARQAQTLPY